VLCIETGNGYVKSIRCFVTCRYTKYIISTWQLMLSNSRRTFLSLPGQSTKDQYSTTNSTTDICIATPHPTDDPCSTPSPVSRLLGSWRKTHDKVMNTSHLATEALLLARRTVVFACAVPLLKFNIRLRLRNLPNSNFC
jgi:hypothetical protein